MDSQVVNMSTDMKSESGVGKKVTTKCGKI